jgi:hypothetical protein
MSVSALPHFMKKFVLLCAVSFATSASATWVKMSENDDADVYIDATTIVKNGDFRQVWQLHDEIKRARDGTRSSRILWEYDCKGERVRMISATGHDGPMATGKKLYNVYKASDWRDIAPDTMGENGFKVVCTK